MANLARVRQITDKDNYVWLLLSLMLLFFGGALAQQLGNETVNRIMGASLTAIILVAVWSLERGRFNLSSRIGITAIFIVIEGGEYLLNVYHLGTVQLVTMLAFVILTISICCRQVLLTGAVDGNKIETQGFYVVDALGNVVGSCSATNPIVQQPLFSFAATNIALNYKAQYLTNA